MTTDEAIRRLKEARGTIQPFRYINEAIDFAIKALEQESKTDVWSIKEVADVLEKHGLIREQETGWIPVTERLPENDEVVLATNSSNDLFKANIWDDCGENKWYANGCFDVPVIAWMPLPEPYKAESEG